MTGGATEPCGREPLPYGAVALAAGPRDRPYVMLALLAWVLVQMAAGIPVCDADHLGTAVHGVLPHQLATVQVGEDTVSTPLGMLNHCVHE